jgi:hypothetical protein
LSGCRTAPPLDARGGLRGSSALVYYLIMAAWLNALLFLGMVVWIRVVIGLVALAAGFYYLRDFVLNKRRSAKSPGERRRRVFERLRSLASGGASPSRSPESSCSRSR